MSAWSAISVEGVCGGGGVQCSACLLCAHRGGRKKGSLILGLINALSAFFRYGKDYGNANLGLATFFSDRIGGSIPTKQHQSHLLEETFASAINTSALGTIHSHSRPLSVTLSRFLLQSCPRWCPQRVELVQAHDV